MSSNLHLLLFSIPCYRVFSHDVTAAILVSQNNEMAAKLVSQTNPWELISFLMQTLSFVPINLHRCWSREWKHSIGEAPGLAGWKQSVPCYQTPQARALERRDTSTSKQHEKQQLPAARFTAWLCLSVTYPNNFMIRKYKINLWKLLFCCCSGNHRQKFYYGHKEIMIPGLSLKLFFVNNIQRYFRFLYLRVIFALC